MFDMQRSKSESFVLAAQLTEPTPDPWLMSAGLFTYLETTHGYALGGMIFICPGTRQLTFGLRSSGRHDPDSFALDVSLNNALLGERSEGTARAAFESGEPLIVDDAENDPIYWSLYSGVGSAICVPVGPVPGAPVAVLAFSHPTEGAFQTDDVMLFQSIGARLTSWMTLDRLRDLAGSRDLGERIIAGDRMNRELVHRRNASVATSASCRMPFSLATHVNTGD